MTDIIVLQGPTGTVHVADIGEIEEIFDLPAYETERQANPIDPVDSEATFCAMFDPRRQKVLEEISLGGVFPVTVQQHHRDLRREGHPSRPTKQHK